MHCGWNVTDTIFVIIEQPELWTKNQYFLIHELTPRGSKFWKIDFIFKRGMVELGRLPIFLKFEQPFFIFGPKCDFLIPNPQRVQILENGFHFWTRHGQITSGTNFHEIWTTFNFSIFGPNCDILIP